MESQQKRVRDLCKAHIKKSLARGNTDSTVDVVGPTLVLAPDAQGNPAAQIGWQVTVWLAHDMLLGQPPVGASMPLPAVMPSDSDWKRCVTHLFEQCLSARAQANNPNPVDANSGIPAGLVGKKL